MEPHLKVQRLAVLGIESSTGRFSSEHYGTGLADSVSVREALAQEDCGTYFLLSSPRTEHAYWPH